MSNAQIFHPPGVSTGTVESSPSHSLGEMAVGQDGSKWLYVLASASAITQYMAVGIDKNFKINRVTKALVDAGNRVGLAQVAFAAGQYGWVALEGSNDLLKVTAKNGCLPSVALYTTATAGYLDDTAASQTLVNGVVLTDTATSSGAAKTCNAFTQMFPTPAP